jgi:hypothetical protein
VKKILPYGFSAYRISKEQFNCFASSGTTFWAKSTRVCFFLVSKRANRSTSRVPGKKVPRALEPTGKTSRIGRPNALHIVITIGIIFRDISCITFISSRISEVIL